MKSIFIKKILIIELIELTEPKIGLLLPEIEQWNYIQEFYRTDNTADEHNTRKDNSF